MQLNKGPYLVTGATGFVGSAVARALAGRGADVRVLARPGGDRRNLEGIDVTVCEGDLLQPETLEPALSGCEGLFHVAADYRLWTRDPDVMFRANVEGSRAVLRAAYKAGIKRAVYTSSVAVLGITHGRQADEEHPCPTAI